MISPKLSFVVLTLCIVALFSSADHIAGRHRLDDVNSFVDSKDSKISKRSKRLLKSKSWKKSKRSKRSKKRSKGADQDDDSKTIIDYFLDTVEKLGDKTFMTQPMGGGDDNIKTFSYKEVLDGAKKVAGYIESLGYPPKSQVAIISKNCAYWMMTDLGIWLAGHVSVPVSPSLTAKTTRYILENSESKMVFIGKLDDESWEDLKEGIPAALDSVSFPLCPADTGSAKAWADVIETSSPIAKPVTRTRDEMATIIYTSGTTGKPKGVMTSYKAMTDITKSTTNFFAFTSDDRYLSYLPISHVIERWTGMIVPMYTGMQIWFVETPTTFVTDIHRCEPTLFMSSPFLWAKFRAEILAKPSGLSTPIMNNSVKKSILKELGLSKCRFAGSGGAPLSQEVLNFYRELGLELLEGYGMTENFNYSHMNQPSKTRSGYVGSTYDDVDCRIAEDGEIQVKSPGTMMGYFKDPEATAETITKDGYTRTGDKGSMDTQHRLKITGRFKDIFKTSKGKYVSPSPIENEIIDNQDVDLAFVGGNSQPQPFAILILSDDAKKKAMAGASERDALGKELEAYLNSINPKFDAQERLQFLVVVQDEWSTENGFLTPTQKIKRAKIEEFYNTKVQGWYDTKLKVIFDEF